MSSIAAEHVATDCNGASPPGTLLYFVADKVEEYARSALKINVFFFLHKKKECLGKRKGL